MVVGSTEVERGAGAEQAIAKRAGVFPYYISTQFHLTHSYTFILTHTVIMQRVSLPIDGWQRPAKRRLQSSKHDSQTIIIWLCVCAIVDEAGKGGRCWGGSITVYVCQWISSQCTTILMEGTYNGKHKNGRSCALIRQSLTFCPRHCLLKSGFEKSNWISRNIQSRPCFYSELSSYRVENQCLQKC